MEYDRFRCLKLFPKYTWPRSVFFSIETAVVFGELYKNGDEWKFNAIGSGYQGGLAALCNSYGVDVE